MNLDYKNSRSPEEILSELSQKHNCAYTDEQFCSFLDEKDQLACFRNQFLIPNFDSIDEIQCENQIADEKKKCIYFCGNSLGLQPKETSHLIKKVLQNWETNSIDSHFSGFLPGALCDHYVEESMAKLVGATKDEIAIMNALTVNLHLLMVSFYRPTAARHKILLEAKAFPSDQFVVSSQIKQRGYNPTESMLVLKPKEGEDIWQPDDIINLIEKEGDSIALVMLSGIHYFTGQLFDIQAITKVAHEKGCMVGFDLAHAVGNVELELHDWDVDFACWCTYKYLNSGPGSMAAAFMHRKHHNNDFPKFLGWWGNKESTKFDMNNTIDACPGIQGYRLSNPSPFLIACIRASLDIFDQTTMKDLREKSVLLTGYLELLLKHYFSKSKSKNYIDIITPSDHRQRGCQLSLVFSCPVSEVHEELDKNGIKCDVRKPNVIRVAPVPLYNSFSDVFEFVEVLKKLL